MSASNSQNNQTRPKCLGCGKSLPIGFRYCNNVCKRAYFKKRTGK